MSKSIIKVNGKYIQDPKKLEVQIMDLDGEEGTGRSQSGLMYRDRVCGGDKAKRKLVMTFPPMHTNELSALLKSVKDTFFDCSYPDPYTGSERTMKCYVGDRSTPIYIKDKYTNEWIWESLSMDFIER